MAQESVLRIAIDSRNAERNAQSISRELQNIERTGDFATRSTDRLSVATRQLAGYMAGLATVGTAISKMDTYTGLNNRLKLVTASQNELNQALKDTFNIAQATGQSWDSTAQVYQRFADNAKRLGITLQETSALTETVAKAISISGGSAASAEAALVQFGQALASGVLRGEEFNSIAEQAPGLLKAIATGLNVNIGELRAMANEGKLTADVVVKSLEKAKVSVDDLYNKTDFTIGNSFTMLNNALTQFVGEAGKGSGSAQLISSSLRELAKNLETVTNVAMVGAAYWAGTYIPALGASVAAGYAKTKQLIEQTAIQYAAINAERAAAAQELASAQATVVNTQATLAALAAEKALEVERLKAQINQAGRIAAATRMAQLRRIETQVTAELTAAESALAAARTRAAAASVTSARVGAGLLGILGGPVGLGLTVAGVAATYLLMSDNASKANAKLEEQAAVANRTASELNKLTGVDRKSAINDLTAAFEAQNKEIRKSELAVGSALIKIQNYAQGNAEVARISNEARLGTISYTDAVKQLNSMKISPDLYNALKKQVEKYDESYIKANKTAVALKGFEVTVKMTGNAAQNAAIQQQKQADALNNTAAAADSAEKALSKLAEEKTDAQYILMTAQNLGGDIEKAKGLLAFRKDLGMGSTGGQVDPKNRAAFEASWAAQQQLKAYEESQRNLAKASSKAEKNHESVRQKASDNATKLREKQFQDREDIYYKYASREMKIEKDLQTEISKIQKANFSPKDTAGYIDNARARGGLEIQLYQAQLDAELNDWKSTEQEKLNQKVYINEMMIQLDADMNDKQKKQALQSLIDKSNYELSWMRLEQEQRISDAGEALRTDLQNIEIKYAFERQQIEKNAKSDDERQRRMALSYASEDYQKRQNLNAATAAWGGTFADLSGTGEQYRIEQDRFSRYDESQALFDAQMALANTAAEREAIWQAHHERMTAIESAYQQGSYGLQLGYGEQVTGALSNMLGTMLGESSSTYQALFYAQRSFALAQAGMNVWKSASDAYANEPGTVWQKIGAAAKATLDQGTFVAMIQAATPKGFANGGYTGHGAKYEPAGIVHKGEGVLTQEEVKALGGPQGFEYLRKSIRRGYATGGLVADTHRVGMGAVNAINSGGGNGSSSGDVNITVNVTDSGVTTQSNQSDQKQLGQMIGNAVRTVIRQEQRQGGLLAK